MGRINIFYSVDNKLFIQQLVSLISLAHTTKEPLNVVNLTLQIPEIAKKGKMTTIAQTKLFNDVLKEANNDSTYTTVDVSKEFREELLKGPNMQNKYYSYFVVTRLLGDLVKEIPDEKVIWLDSDTIMINDIKELFDIDLNGAEIAGRKDKGRIFNYFQSGVMLMDMKKIRETGMLKRARELVTTKKYICYIDMSALNTATKKKVMLNKKFNSFKYDKDAVVHHVCDTREGKILFTKKWWHRIKTDEVEFMRKIYLEYAYIYDKIEEYKISHKEAFE